MMNFSEIKIKKFRGLREKIGRIGKFFGKFLKRSPIAAASANATIAVSESTSESALKVRTENFSSPASADLVKAMLDKPVFKDTDGVGMRRTQNLSSKSSNPTGTGIVLSPAEAEEYCEFKRRKRVDEAKASLTKSEIFAADRDFSLSDIKRLCEEAKKVGAAAVKINPLYVSALKSLEGSGAAIDAIVGGTGETGYRAKMYEAKTARRGGAKEITLNISFSLFRGGRTGEVKKEIRKVCRAARNCPVKVTADGELTYTEVLRLSRLAAEAGAKYLSVPYSSEVGRLRRDLHDACMLETTGVETASEYKTAIAAGVERIVTSHAVKICDELIDEAENYSFAVPFAERAEIKTETGRGREGGSVAKETADKEKIGAMPLNVVPDKKPLGGTPLN